SFLTTLLTRLRTPPRSTPFPYTTLFRSVQLRYAKNLQGLEGGIDASNVVTRVVPVGQTKDGKPLYLSGQKYVESSNASSYPRPIDRKSTRLNSSHVSISYAVFCLKKKTS